MNKLLSIYFLAFFGIISVSKAQSLKIEQFNTYFNYKSEDKFIQIIQEGDKGKIKMNLIHKYNQNKDSVVLIKLCMNKNYELVDSFLVYDLLGRKLIESNYSDSIHDSRTQVKRIYSFYNLSGTLHGKYAIYDYESESKNAKRFIYRIENYDYGTKNGEFLKYFDQSEQVELIRNFKNNLLNGEYILYDQDGTYNQKGMYKNNLKSGAWTSYRGNNQPAMYEQYQNGKRHGQYKEWFENGNMAVMTNYSDGLINSYYFSYYPNKQRKDSCTYNNGKLYGKNISYYEDGKIKMKSEYKEGRMIGDYKFWDEKGQLLQHFPYKFGYLNGTVLKYFSNGKLSEKYGMKNDTLDGEYSTFYENGKVKSKVKYKMGEIQKGAIYLDEIGKKMEIIPEDIKEADILINEHEEQEQIPLIENVFVVEQYKIELTNPFTKDDLKLWKKIKGKEIKVRILKNGAFEILFDKAVFNAKTILKANELLTRHLMVKPYKLDGYPYACTVTIKLE
jgi:antitoxin component YwqK of YwqJK toxin-antitoxin module